LLKVIKEVASGSFKVLIGKYL